MDRISALRNIEDALGAFERGETDLASMEREVLNVLRTYATDFGDDTDLAAYRASGDERADGLVVVATTPDEAATRIRELLDGGDSLDFAVERLG
jgi:alkanesulfonate monooxygenase SsuD/methylene tetrahydromethanopterin reductase-like flavin-dependent oxidoreductase (luciferase family)